VKTKDEILELVRRADPFDLRFAFKTESLAGMPADDEQDNDDDQNDDDENNDDDNDDEDDDEVEDKKSKDKKDPKKDFEKERLIAENKRRRLAAREARERAEKLEKELNEIKNKDKPELEQVTKERDELKSRITELESTNRSLAIGQKFRDVIDAKEYRFNVDTEDVLELVLRRYSDDIEIEKDGSVSGLDDAVEAFVKAKPGFVKPKKSKNKDSDDDDETDDDTEPTRQASGRSGNGKKGKKGEFDDAKLMEQYPALRR
jgi:hypothetical protein